ncbi:MAG TPA: DUF2892 domain-containing protein [Dehalococcoidia bacterium]|nr:DUF2892 domain-containing protein [Dehalococcoidia bacterium]
MNTNEGSLDRALRVALGVVLLVIGFAVQGTVGVIVGVIGLVPLLTGLVGWCPLYTLLHIDTLRSRFGGRHGGGAQPR